MGKQPYIPLYIGDWEQDTNCISLEAEGALLKLTFKLWKSFAKGLLEISLTQIAILFKKTPEKSLEILKELQQNEVLNIQFLPENKFKIESRRMLREAELTRLRSELGKKGGSTTQAKLKQTKKKALAKLKQNPDNEIENENRNEIENKGGTGEKEEPGLTWKLRERHKKSFPLYIGDDRDDDHLRSLVVKLKLYKQEQKKQAGAISWAVSDKELIDLFEFFYTMMPGWWKDNGSSLSTLNSKFDTIMQQISKNNNQITNSIIDSDDIDFNTRKYAV